MQDDPSLRVVPRAPQDQHEENDQARSVEPQLRAGESDQRVEDRGDPLVTASEAHSRGLPVLGAAGAFGDMAEPRLNSKAEAANRLEAAYQGTRGCEPVRISDDLALAILGHLRSYP